MNLSKKNLLHKHRKICTNIINLSSEVIRSLIHTSPNKKSMLGLKELTSTILIKYHTKIMQNMMWFTLPLVIQLDAVVLGALKTGVNIPIRTQTPEAQHISSTVSSFQHHNKDFSLTSPPIHDFINFLACWLVSVFRSPKIHYSKIFKNFPKCHLCLLVYLKLSFYPLQFYMPLNSKSLFWHHSLPQGFSTFMICQACEIIHKFIQLPHFYWWAKRAIIPLQVSNRLYDDSRNFSTFTISLHL